MGATRSSFRRQELCWPGEQELRKTLAIYLLSPTSERLGLDLELRGKPDSTDADEHTGPDRDADANGDQCTDVYTHAVSCAIDSWGK